MHTNLKKSFVNNKQDGLKIFKNQVKYIKSVLNVMKARIHK